MTADRACEARFADGRHRSCVVGWRDKRLGAAPVENRRGFSPKQEGIDVDMATIIWFVIAAIIVFWLLGMIGSIGGSLIHLLLVVALLLLIFNLVTGRRAV
jgi:Flp pilus assembly protein TadB